MSKNINKLADPNSLMIVAVKNYLSLEDINFKAILGETTLK